MQRQPVVRLGLQRRPVVGPGLQRRTVVTRAGLWRVVSEEDLQLCRNLCVALTRERLRVVRRRDPLGLEWLGGGNEWRRLM